MASAGGNRARAVTDKESRTIALTAEEEAYHHAKAAIAKQVLQKVHGAHHDFSDSDDDGINPPSAPIPNSHYHRRASANAALAAAEDYITSGQVTNGETLRRASVSRRDGGDAPQAVTTGGFQDKEHDEEIHNGVAKAMKHVVKNMDKDKQNTIQRARESANRRPDSSEFEKLKQKNQRRASSVAHDQVQAVLKNGGTEMSRITPPAHQKPVLKDPMGLLCVKHLKDPRWTVLARHIRGTIYDPDFYDDGTYAPMYVRLAIHGALTWHHTLKDGGLEGGAMRYRPEYSDAHNKFCKHIIKRQHDEIKVKYPWASYADIQCLCGYVSIECAGGPVIPFTPGRRDVIPLSADEPDADEKFGLLNYHVRGDTGPEDQLAPNPNYKEGEEDDMGCPYLRKNIIKPGRVPPPEAGKFGNFKGPVSAEAEATEMKEVAMKIREHFLEICGTTEQFAVALISGGHSFGRCHPEISGYAGPWTNNPGTFSNLYCKKLMDESENWQLVDKTMEDCSGDLITGLKPKGMRRQYVNKGGKGDLMMLVSDMAMARDPVFSKHMRHYANNFEDLKRDFGTAFKWITEQGFEPPPEKSGLATKLFTLKIGFNNCMQWLGTHICNTGAEGPLAAEDGAEDAPKVGQQYTMEEVAKHNTVDDLWIVINNKVVNVSQFKNEHPGGIPILKLNAGKDASAEWNSIHARNTIENVAPHVVIGYIE